MSIVVCGGTTCDTTKSRLKYGALPVQGKIVGNIAPMGPDYGAIGEENAETRMFWATVQAAAEMGQVFFEGLDEAMVLEHNDLRRIHPVAVREGASFRTGRDWVFNPPQPTESPISSSTVLDYISSPLAKVLHLG